MTEEKQRYTRARRSKEEIAWRIAIQSVMNLAIDYARDAGKGLGEPSDRIWGVLSPLGFHIESLPGTDTSAPRYLPSPTWEYVVWFASQMEAQLDEPKNRAKGNRDAWVKDHPLALLMRAREELDELAAVLVNRGAPERAIKEAADAANMLMMAADAYAAQYPDVAPIDRMLLTVAADGAEPKLSEPADGLAWDFDHPDFPMTDGWLMTLLLMSVADRIDPDALKALDTIQRRALARWAATSLYNASDHDDIEVAPKPPFADTVCRRGEPSEPAERERFRDAVALSTMLDGY